MKKILLITLLSFVIILTHAQEKTDKLIYRVGAGPVIEGNIGLLGINIMNELSYRVHDRISINPSLTYFNSVTDLDGYYWTPMYDGKNVNEFSSSLFTDVKLQLDLIRTPNDFRLGIAFGPSYQFGGEAYHRGWFGNEQGQLESAGYEVTRFNRLGYVSQVTFDWKGANINRSNTLGISMSSFDGYWPYYLMVNYRLGFVLL